MGRAFILLMTICSLLGVAALTQLCGIDRPLTQAETVALIEVVFEEDEREIAECIAWNESRFDPGAVSVTDDHGLFQINAGWVEGWNGKRSEIPFMTLDESRDPVTNAVAAQHIASEYGWDEWATYSLCASFAGGCHFVTLIY